MDGRLDLSGQVCAGLGQQWDLTTSSAPPITKEAGSSSMPLSLTVWLEKMIPEPPKDKAAAAAAAMEMECQEGRHETLEKIFVPSLSGYLS